MITLCTVLEIWYLTNGREDGGLHGQMEGCTDRRMDKKKSDI